MSTVFQPPPGYLRVDSAVDGVSVWAPAPEEGEDPHARRGFKCPSCGAPIAFHEGQGALSCPYCGHTDQALGDRVGRAAEEQEFTVEAMERFRADQGLGVERRELHCQTCGAELAVEEDAIAAACPFCASAAVNLRVANHPGQRPGHVLPFSVDQATARKAAAEWIGQGWMRPGDLDRVDSVRGFTGIYMPWWTFSARLANAWKAEVGYERTERYYDSSSGSWKTRTVIDWRWESGHVSVPVSDLLVAGAGTLSARLLQGVADFELGALAVYDPGYLAGWQAQSYAVDVPTAWERARAQMREQGRRACRDSISSRHVRNFSMSADFDEETWRYVLLPVWISAFPYGGEVYQVLVNGQTATVVGRKPVAWWKIWLAIAAMFTPSVLLGLLGLALLVVGIGLVPLIIALVLFVVAVVGAFVLYGKASDQEAE